MYMHLHKYFALHHTAALPGVGYFSVVQEPAEADFVNKEVKGPAYSVVFHADAAAEDGRMVHFLAAEAGITAEESGDAVHTFARTAGAVLEAGEQLHLPGIGFLAMQEGRYHFIADTSVQQYFPPVSAGKVVRQHASHTIRVGEDEKTSEEMHELLQQEVAKDRWWFTAVLLALIGVAVIAAYHINR